MVPKSTRLIISLLTAISALPANADDATPKTPRVVLIIRHAEKPADEAVSDGLTTQGEERAIALCRLFEKSADRPEPFPTPDFIFAAKPTKNSHRSKLTVAPLAQRLKLPVNDNFGKDQFDRLAREFTGPKYAGKTVLICWQHGTIPQLAAALGAADVPASWHADRFNRVWRLDFDREGKAHFSDRPQHLLKSDAVK